MDVTPHFPIYLDYGATNAGRSSRRRRDDSLVARAFRQSGIAQSCRGGGKPGEAVEKARVEVADLIRRRSARDRLDVWCH